MREIKFRAWDTRFNDIHYYPEIHQWNLNMPDLEECTLMQYTGLKDKKGKEIYEGDIVKCNYCNKDFGEIIYYADMVRFQIKWNENDCGNARHTSIGNWCEIIGNIYENPELLSTQTKSE